MTGGVFAEVNEFPWIVKLGGSSCNDPPWTRPAYGRCMGTIIRFDTLILLYIFRSTPSPKLVATAFHCLRGIKTPERKPPPVLWDSDFICPHTDESE